MTLPKTFKEKLALLWMPLPIMLAVYSVTRYKVFFVTDWRKEQNGAWVREPDIETTSRDNQQINCIGLCLIFQGQEGRYFGFGFSLEKNLNISEFWSDSQALECRQEAVIRWHHSSKRKCSVTISCSITSDSHRRQCWRECQSSERQRNSTN